MRAKRFLLSLLKGLSIIFIDISNLINFYYIYITLAYAINHTAIYILILHIKIINLIVICNITSLTD